MYFYTVLTHHHPLYVDLQFQLFYCLSSICNLGHVVWHPAPLKSANPQQTIKCLVMRQEITVHIIDEETNWKKKYKHNNSLWQMIEGICAKVRDCFNLLVNSAPWVSAASGTGRVSKEQGRAGEAKQPSPGGHPLAENVNTPNTNINSWRSWSIASS